MKRTHRGHRASIAIFGLAILAFASLTPPSALALAADPPNGLTRMEAAYAGSALIRGIATFDAVPTAPQVAALQALGLTVQPMKRVPLALVFGPVAAMQSAVASGAANDVYPDETIELFDMASANAMGAAAARAAGFTGKGVTVAVVDSGCDATHPDLANRVKRNVKLYSAEYVNIPPDRSNTIVVPMDMGLYQNSDIGSGHGTHVAGIIAADGTTAPDRIGVAPAADLVCYSIGEVLFTTAVVTAYDHLLDQPNLWDVDVVNNSWGNSFRQFDPRDPVNVVTRAVSDLGVTVVFASGNSGHSNVEMGLNPFSQAPWNISVANGTLAFRRSNSSSSGLIYDNSLPTQVGGGGFTVYTGNRIGIYHPDVTAPGTSISSTCATTGNPAVIGPCPPPNYANRAASGTSMASPHVAGAAAVLLQANPNLTTDQVRSALQATTTPVFAADGVTHLPFWQVGYGYVHLSNAVTLVRQSNWAEQIAAAQAQADQRVLDSDPYSVQRSDFWTYDAPRVAVAGVTDRRTFTTPVPAGTSNLKVTLSHPSGAVLGSNNMIYTATVRDAAGQVLGTTTEASTGAGTASLFLNLASNASITYGSFTVEVVGERAVSDPDTIDSESLLGRMVTVQVVQLVPDANRAPVAANDNYSASEDAALHVTAPGVLANDTDGDGNALSASVASAPSNGTLALAANGAFSYTPAANYNGPDSFTYKASDGKAESNVATVTITAAAVNDAPTAANDAFSTTEDTPLHVTAPGVLANDGDIDGDSLSAAVVSGPANGTLSLAVDGGFTYTPNANYNGPDSFSYKASDGSLDSNTAAVSISVAAVNDAPVASDDAYTTDEDTALDVATPGVLANDADVDRDALTVSLVTGPSNGTLALAADGSFQYTPNANYNGADSFTYKVSDGTVDSNVASVSITVTAVNDAPIANNDAYTTKPNAAITISAPGVLGNDADIDSASITAALVSGPSHGTVALNADGSFLYSPSSGFKGTDTFSYKANDGQADSNVATVAITVTTDAARKVAVSGNGEILVQNPDGSASFGFNVKRAEADGPASGQLEYFNHARGLSVQSVSITSLNVSGTTSTFSGTCTKNGAPCSFTVTVEDNAEPGKGADRFSIAVSEESVEGATAPIVAGNIQVR